MKSCSGFAVAAFPAFIFTILLTFTFCPLLVGQQSPHCAQNLFCLFNQEAARSDSAGIQKYSEDLIGLIVPISVGTDSTHQLTNRLAKAEQAARAAGGKLVPEATVVKTFDDLMQGIGAPPSVKASEPSVHAFREHAASMKAFPALFTVDRNGTNCNPGEALFLFYLLISNNGILYKENLNTAQALMQMNSQKSNGYGAAYIEGLGLGTKKPDTSASSLLSSYSSHYNRNSTITLLNHIASMLGY